MQKTTRREFIQAAAVQLHRIGQHGQHDVVLAQFVPLAELDGREQVGDARDAQQVELADQRLDVPGGADLTPATAKAKEVILSINPERANVADLLVSALGCAFTQSCAFCFIDAQLEQRH